MLLALLLAAQAPSANVFLEREILLLANARCGLLSAAAQTSLEAGARQAGWAARREGLAAPALAALKTEAQLRADSLTCAAPVLRRSAAEAEAAFAGWTRAWSQSFPGAHAVWLARRVADRSGFLLEQKAGPWVLGVRLEPEATAAVLTLQTPPGDWRQATLQLRRAGAAAPEPSTVRRLARPPRQSADAFLARQRTAQAGATLFVFERAVLERLRLLAPHEGAVATLISREGAVLEHVFEVGDFSLGLALIQGQGRTLR